MSSEKPWVQKHWDMRAAFNFIGGGTGTGLLLWTAVFSFLGGSPLPIGLVALAFIGFGLFMVWMEIGRKLRAINVLFHPHTSWMTREAYAAMPVFGLGVLAVFLESAIVTALAALFGMVFLYCQGRILKAAKGIPAWRIPVIVPLIISTGLCEGIGIFMLIGLAFQPEAVAVAGPLFTAALLVMIAMRAYTWRIYRNDLKDGNAPLDALAALDKAESTFTVVGTVSPVVLILGALVIPEASAPLAMFAGLSAALGGWFMKSTIITKAAYNQGFAINHTPIRGVGETRPGIKPGW